MPKSRQKDKDVLQSKIVPLLFRLDLIWLWLVAERRCMPDSCYPQRLQSAFIMVLTPMANLALENVLKLICESYCRTRMSQVD